MKPKPRERSDCEARGQLRDDCTIQLQCTHPLIIDNGDLLNMAVPAEFLFEIAFLSPDAQSEHAQHV